MLLTRTLFGLFFRRRCRCLRKRNKKRVNSSLKAGMKNSPKRMVRARRRKRRRKRREETRVKRRKRAPLVALNPVKPKRKALLPNHPKT